MENLSDDDLDFGLATELVLDEAEIPRERWARVAEKIDIRDVMESLHGIRHSPCSCPYHGTDRKPSFYIYPATNSCFCHGCPDGEGQWDAVKLTARSLGITRKAALLKLEADYALPKWVDIEATEDVEDIPPVQEEGPEAPTVTKEDLERFVVAAQQALQTTLVEHTHLAVSHFRQLHCQAWSKAMVLQKDSS